MTKINKKKTMISKKKLVERVCEIYDVDVCGGREFIESMSVWALRKAIKNNPYKKINQNYISEQ